MLFRNEPYFGKPTKVFAYLGVPKTTGDAIPAMVLLHGGGGKAFKEWVRLWNDKGYAAISMDFGGYGLDGEKLLEAGPEQGHPEKFATELAWKNMWTYHAIAAVIRSHNIIRRIPEVDDEKVGVTGISWGGYLTCIASGVDNRFACAAPVYGCGFLQDNSDDGWMDIFAKMSGKELNLWHELCDPASYLPNSEMPMLFVTGTNDFAYPLDSLKKSYSLCKGLVTLCVKHEMPHGHEAGWAPLEITAFTNSIFTHKVEMPKISETSIEGEVAYATFSSEIPVTKGYLLYTRDTGKWKERLWKKKAVDVLSGDTISTKIPDGCSTLFLAVEN
ncbi:MAG: acetylxylan esterase, partial [Victivallales bacterium]|nr:acetylxylan esterase [Victivallales bacterium]